LPLRGMRDDEGEPSSFGGSHHRAPVTDVMGRTCNPGAHVDLSL
jgi:hypothetical protein